ncbi:hypothetical protein OIE66_23630 [Nonomuraea sp. NBC_01738]|uniref:hypothetical protein n=1 Tax=Nonomuraea sp. NBC_01738 TaxID=2976003 RepID=UPI002E15CCB8|nr:hypothetical protein OIE66_23630 [Nonomuraea sp. NBC_01738]
MEPVKNGKTPQIQVFAGHVANFRTQEEQGMADVIYVALTIVIFVIFGLVVKAVERL